MSDNIPFEIQMEIIKMVDDLKSLIQFRSVSKPWKSFIDSREFIQGYGVRNTQPHSRILSLSNGVGDELRFICLVDDDVETLKVQQQELAPFVVSPLLKQLRALKVVGACHGLLCLYCCYENEWMIVIWNPSIGKSFGIAVPRCHRHIEIQMVYGFGVCPVTSDPTVVRVSCPVLQPWNVEVFTLSSGVWDVIPSGNLPRQSVTLNKPSTQVVIDRFIYWGACEMIFVGDGTVNKIQMVMSFDLITKDFKVVDLPESLRNELLGPVSVSKLRGSLVVYGGIDTDEANGCGVWVMEHDSSFRKLFTIDAHVSKILGFSKSGETVSEIPKEGVRLTTLDEILIQGVQLPTLDEILNEGARLTTLDVYDPCTQQIKNLGISAARGSFFMGTFKKSLLLLDHLDSHIYHDNN